MQAALFIDEPGWYAGRHRLAACMAVSAVMLFLVLAMLDWPASLELPRLVPLELEITVLPPREETEPEARERPPPDALPLPAPAAPAAPARATEPAAAAGESEPVAPAEAAEVRAEPAAQAAGAERPVVSAPQAEAPAAPVDWYAELERAAAAAGARAAAEPKSMHPEFDELRRIAALRYGKPRTSKAPPLAWDWKAEKDTLGRTLLKRGNTYIILDDPRLFNRYAFETFEKNMILFAFPLGRPPPKNLPWVETIRARYEYLREPDELPPLKATGAGAGARTD